MGRRALLEPGPDHLSKCAGLRGGGPLPAAGNEGRWGCRTRHLAKEGAVWPPGLHGPRGSVLVAALTQRHPGENQREIRLGPSAEGQLRMSSLRHRPRLQSTGLSAAGHVLEAEVTSAFGVRASPRISPSPGQSQGVSPPKTALRRAPQPWQGPVTLPSRCCQTSLGCERLRGARGRAAEAGRKPRDAGLPGGAGADVRGALWDTRPGPLAASSPLEYPDFVDGRQGGRHVGLKVSVVHPGLAKRPRRGVVLPVVVPVPFAVRPEAVQVHLRAGQR